MFHLRWQAGGGERRPGFPTVVWFVSLSKEHPGELLEIFLLHTGRLQQQTLGNVWKDNTLQAISPRASRENVCPSKATQKLPALTY